MPAENEIPNTKNNWLLGDESEAPKLPTPPVEPPSLKGLEDINNGRQEKADFEATTPKPMPSLPTAQSPDKSEPAEAITEKTFAKLLENVVKFSGDANISMEKCISDLHNILGKINYSSDKSLEPTVKEQVEKATSIKKSLEELNQAVSGYRKDTIEGEAKNSEIL